MGADGEDPHPIFSVAPSIIRGGGRLGWSPNSKRIVFMIGGLGSERANFSIESCDANGSDRLVAVLDTRQMGNLTWLRDGRVLFSMAEPPPNQRYFNIWSIQVDLDTGRPHGPPLQITTGIGFAEDNFSSSADGSRVTFKRVRTRDPARIGEILSPSGNLGTIRDLAGDNWENWPVGWTAGGEQVFFVSNHQGKWGVFKQDLRTQNTQALASMPEGFKYPYPSPVVLSPDREWLLFREETKDNDSKSGPSLMRMPVSGGRATPFLAGPLSYYGCASRANVCVLSEVTAGKETYAFLDPTKGRGSNIAEAQAIAGSWTISPDGKTLAIVPQEQKTRIEFLRTDGKRLGSIPVKGSSVLESMVWAADGQALWVTGLVGTDFHIFRVGLDGRFKSLWKFSFNQSWPYINSASPDGRYLTFNVWTWEDNVTLLENF